MFAKNGRLELGDDVFKYLTKRSSIWEPHATVYICTHFFSFLRSFYTVINTKFLGIVDNYNEILRSCSVLFSPYPENARYLGSKNKFLEAAACQMPIVTTSSGAIDFRNDLLLIGDTTKELTDLIRSMKDENERNDLGKKRRSEIEQNYNADIEVKKIIKLYTEFSN